MLTRNEATSALESITALTQEIELLIRSWPGRNDKELSTLAILQERNRHVFTLSRKIVNLRTWDLAVEEELRRFLMEELEERDSLLKQKLGCLYVSGTLKPTWQLTYERLLGEIKETRKVDFLFSDLYAFDALGGNAYEKYQTIFEPITQAYNGRLVITPVGRTDTLYAYIEPVTVEGLTSIMQFASELRRRILECRSSMVLPDAVSFSIGVSSGGLKFSKLTGEPVPDSSQTPANAWYDAAKLMGKAERLAKHHSSGGGIILVSDDINNRLGDICARRNMNTFDPDLEDCEVNIYDEPQRAKA